MMETSNAKKPTIDYLLHEGYIVKTINGAGEYVYTLTVAGEAYFGGDALFE